MTVHSETTAADNGERTGILLAVMAYGLWGFYALFFKQLADVSPIEVTAHRALWAVPIAGVVLLILGRTRDIPRVLRTPRLLGLLVLTTCLVTINWGFFVWAVSVHRTVEASLGYYINPLLNVLVGFVVLKERMSPLQVLAVALAVSAVLIQTVALGVFPWLAVLLGSTFCLYGFLRKTIDVGPSQGFFIEASILSLGSLGLLWWLHLHGELHFGHSLHDTVFLILGGPMTAGPLMLFAAAARRIRFSTLGLLQYIAPTGLFLTAVFVFGEPVGFWRLLSFVLIWTGLALYSLEALRRERRSRATAMVA